VAGPKPLGTHISYLHWIVPDDILPQCHMTKQILGVSSLGHPPRQTLQLQSREQALKRLRLLLHGSNSVSMVTRSCTASVLHAINEI
jgi:hypothetical protein